MTAPPRDDAALRSVWIAFAGQFLDTDTRSDLPVTALTALEAGFGVEQAERIWWEDVEPAVGLNLLLPLGAWGGFDDAWLVERILEVRRSRTGPAPPRHGDPFEPTWRALRGCMEALAAVAPPERWALARDLESLARHYFDFAPGRLDLAAPGRADGLERLFREVFLPVFEPLVWRGETPRRCRRRVERALGREPRLARWWRVLASAVSTRR